MEQIIASGNAGMAAREQTSPLESWRKEQYYEVHQKIVACGRIAGENLLQMAQQLKRMRDEKLYEEAGYATFDSYTESELNLRKSQAYKYINVLESMGEEYMRGARYLENEPAREPFGRRAERGTGSRERNGRPAKRTDPSAAQRGGGKGQPDCGIGVQPSGGRDDGKFHPSGKFGCGGNGAGGSRESACARARDGRCGSMTYGRCGRW